MRFHHWPTDCFARFLVSQLSLPYVCDVCLAVLTGFIVFIENMLANRLSSSRSEWINGLEKQRPLPGYVAEQRI